MENASKALIIAGGVLIAMITISVFYYMYGHISEFSHVIQDDTVEEERRAFNESFTAYQKKLMYGSDVISVINKAVDNNKRYNVENESDNGYYVDVSFTLIDELIKREETYKLSDDEKTYVKSKDKEISRLLDATSYSISGNYNNINELIKEAQKSTEPVRKNKTGNKKVIEYTLTYSYGAEFKRKMFKCTNVEYHQDTGRVSLMTFEEKEQPSTT